MEVGWCGAGWTSGWWTFPVSATSVALFLLFFFLLFCLYPFPGLFSLFSPFSFTFLFMQAISSLAAIALFFINSMCISI